MRYLPRLDILCKLCGSLAIHWRTYLLVCGGAGCSLAGLGRDTECLLMTGLLVCLHTSSIMCCAAATLIRSYQYQPRYLLQSCQRTFANFTVPGEYPYTRAFSFLKVPSNVSSPQGE